MEFAFAARSTVVLTALAGVPLVIAPGALLEVAFGAAYRDAAVAVYGTVVAAVALGCWKLFVANLSASGESAMRLRSAGVALVTLVVLDLVLVPTLGIIGASWACACAYSLAALMVVRRWLATSDQRWVALVPRPRDVAFGLAAFRGRTEARAA